MHTGTPPPHPPNTGEPITEKGILRKVSVCISKLITNLKEANKKVIVGSHKCKAFKILFLKSHQHKVLTKMFRPSKNIHLKQILN